LSAAPPLSPRPRWLSIAKWLIVALVAWHIGHTIYDAWDGLVGQAWTIRPLWLLLAGALYLVGLLPSGFFWYGTMRRLGQTPRLLATLRAYYVGHLGKYVPGKAMVVVVRAGMVRGPGVQTAVAALAVFCETLTSMAVAAFLAAALLAVWFREQQFFIWIALALMAVSVTPTLPPVFRRLVRLSGVARQSAALSQLDRLTYRWLLGGWVTIAVGWGVIGLSLWATLCGLGIVTAAGQPPALLAQLPLWTATVSLATVAGFLSLIPGGAGVREAVIIGLMQQAGFTSGEALLAAGMLRIVWLAAELAVAGASYAAGPTRAGDAALPAEREPEQEVNS
jgi:uncharacterized membrane protein YbhN (UPF0104 family)